MSLTEIAVLAETLQWISADRFNNWTCLKHAWLTEEVNGNNWNSQKKQTAPVADKINSIQKLYVLADIQPDT